jgi:hypothetical protein
VNGYDLLGMLGLENFQLVVVKNTGGRNNNGTVNNSGDWGSPGGNFKTSSYTRGRSSVSTKLIGIGPVGTHCCNTVEGPAGPSAYNPREQTENNDAGSVIVYLVNAPKGTYTVNLTFTGKATISPIKGEDVQGAASRLNFFVADSLNRDPNKKVNKVSTGYVSYSTLNHNKDILTWKDSVDTKSTVTVLKNNAKVEVARYNVMMELYGCGDITVEADGGITVNGY